MAGALGASYSTIRLQLFNHDLSSSIDYVCLDSRCSYVTVGFGQVLVVE